MNETLIKKQKINILISETDITIFDKIQCTSFNAFNCNNKIMLNKMSTILINSNENEFNTWADILDLAYSCKMRGFSGYVPEKYRNLL